MLVGVVVCHPHQGDQVSAHWQGIAQKVAANRTSPLGQALLLEAGLRQCRDLRQIKQLELQVRGVSRELADKSSLTATNIEHAPVVGESVGGDHFVNHEGLRGGHQVGIAAHLVGLPAALSGCA